MKRVLMLLMGIAMMSSCTKEGLKNDDLSNRCQLISYTEEDGFRELLYDSKGNVIEYTINNKYGKHVLKYTYTNSSIIIERNYTSEDFQDLESYTYKLDQNKRVVERTVDSDWIIKYSYSDDGYLSSIIANGEVIEKFEYVNGNLKNIKNLSFNETMSFEYDITKAHVPFMTSAFGILGEDFDYLHDPLFEKGYFGKISKNRIKKNTFTYDSIVDVYNFTYQEDAKGNVTKIEQSNEDEEWTVSRVFECK